MKLKKNARWQCWICLYVYFAFISLVIWARETGGMEHQRNSLWERSASCNYHIDIFSSMQLLSKCDGKSKGQSLQVSLSFCDKSNVDGCRYIYLLLRFVVTFFFIKLLSAVHFLFELLPFFLHTSSTPSFSYTSISTVHLLFSLGLWSFLFLLCLCVVFLLILC